MGKYIKPTEKEFAILSILWQEGAASVKKVHEKLASKTYPNWALLVIMAVAGHFGAGITHGESYLFEAWQKTDTTPQFSENDPMYKAAIFPILEAKCVACHQPNGKGGGAIKAVDGSAVVLDADANKQIMVLLNGHFLLKN